MHKKGYKNHFISPNESVLDQKHKLRLNLYFSNSKALMASLVNGAEPFKQFYMKHLCEIIEIRASGLEGEVV